MLGEKESEQRMREMLLDNWYQVELRQVGRSVMVSQQHDSSAQADASVKCVCVCACRKPQHEDHEVGAKSGLRLSLCVRSFD